MCEEGNWWNWIRTGTGITGITYDWDWDVGTLDRIIYSKLVIGLLVGHY